MAKTQQRRKTQQRETNWVVIGGLIGVGVLIFGGLLFLALRTPPAETVLPLVDYCSENPDSCIAEGDTNAPVKVVEIADFGCPHCQDFHENTAGPLREQYVDTGQVEWITLPYALSTTTLPASAAAMCAAEQTSYFDYAQALFGIEDANVRISSTGLREAAEELNLNIDDFVSCLDSGRYSGIVSDNRTAASRVGVTGTPSFFVNGEMITGAQPLNVFQQAISDALSSS
ncbi:MAG: thioredoxin domain-containing protein [Chloroflexota bacterium]